MQYIIYPSEVRDHGFRITDDTGTVVMEQDFAPALEGFVPMTEAEAAQYAQQIILEMEAGPPPVPASPEQLAAKLAELSAACQSAIYAGIEVNGARYSLKEHDQTEIMAQLSAIKDGAAAVFYHADGELCRQYPAEEFAALVAAAISHIFYHRTLCNHLNAWARRAGTADELSAITYGSALPDDLAAHMAEVLSSAQAL